MATFRLSVTIAGVCIATFALLQLLSVIETRTQYSHLGASSKLWFGRNRKFDNDVYLLGAGKADITGYCISEYISKYQETIY